jgi:hypothetical protein
MEHIVNGPERRRFLRQIVREISRAELTAIEHAAKESRRLGEDAPPAAALRAVAAHAEAMQLRFAPIVAGYDVESARGSLGATLATLRDRIVDRIVQGERAYRIAMLDLRHGLEIVRLLRDAARRDQLLGMIRWCDDWLGLRRTLVSHAERELVWFSAAPAHRGVSPHATPAPDERGIHAGAPPTSDDRPTSHDHR